MNQRQTDSQTVGLQLGELDGVFAPGTQGIDSTGHGNQLLSRGGPRSGTGVLEGDPKKTVLGLEGDCAPSPPAVRGMRAELPGREGHSVSLGCDQGVFPIAEGGRRGPACADRKRAGANYLEEGPSAGVRGDGHSGPGGSELRVSGSP